MRGAQPSTNSSSTNSWRWDDSTHHLSKSEPRTRRPTPWSTAWAAWLDKIYPGPLRLKGGHINTVDVAALVLVQSTLTRVYTEVRTTSVISFQLVLYMTWITLFLYCTGRPIYLLTDCLFLHIQTLPTATIMSQLWGPPPSPISKLARYRTLSPLAGVRVSPIQLGTMGLGDKWHGVGMGSMDKESSFKLLDAFFELGVGPSIHFFRHLPTEKQTNRETL